IVTSPELHPSAWTASSATRGASIPLGNAETMRLQFTNSLLHTYFYLCNNLGFDYELFPRRCGFQLAAFAIQEREHTDLRGKTVGQAIDRRHRNKNGRIARKYGNTYIRTLRIRYGVGFAHGEHAERKLIDV